jgi:hypothetical protein
MLRKFLRSPFPWVSNLDWRGVSLLISSVIVIALATVKGAELQWQSLGDYSGGINTVSHRGQLAVNQYLSLQNFLFTPSGLESRKGYYLAYTLSGNPITFVDVYRKKSGTSHLIAGDGFRIWSVIGMTGTPKELATGTYTVSNVDVDSAANLVHGNSVSTQKWLALYGSCENCLIKVGDTTRTISKIILDTLIYTTVAYNKSQTGASYSLIKPGTGGAAITINRGLTLSDKYWLFTTNGFYSMDSPDTLNLKTTQSGIRYLISTPYVGRTCYNGQACLRFTSSAMATGQSGYFMRLTSDQRSNTAHNPIPAGRSFYMSYPILNTNATQVTTTAAAFMPDSTATGAEYFTTLQLSPYTDSLRRVMVDSVVRVEQEWSDDPCSYNPVYLKIYCDTCHWKSDTARFITGDWFVSPEIGTSSTGSLVADTNTGPAMTNRIIGAMYRTPAHDQIRVTSMTAAVKFSSGTNAYTIKGAIYKKSSMALIDTTQIVSGYSSANYNPATITLTFANPVALDATTDYVFSLWTNTASLTFRYTATTGNYKEFGQTLSYTGTFPATFAPTDSSTLMSLAIRASLTYFENVNPSSKLGLNNATAATCYPVVGGYVTSDSAILVASDTAGFPDHGQRKVSFFRMVRTASASTTDSNNYIAAAAFEGRVFHVKGAAKQTIYRSDLFNPDSTLAATIILTDPSGEDITTIKGQSDYLKVYTANNRYVVSSTDGYTYTINKLGSGVGCVAPNTVCENSGIHYYLHYTGVYRDDGSADLGLPVSAPINSWFTDSISADKYGSAVAVLRENQYWISIVTKSDQNKTFVFDITTNAWTDMSNLNFASGVNYGTAVDSMRFLFGSRDSGLVMAYGSSSDRGATIPLAIQTGYLDQDDPTVLKDYSQIWNSYDRPGGAAMSLSLYLQPPTAWTTISAYNSNEIGNYRFNPPQTTGKAVSVRLDIADGLGYRQGTLRIGYVVKSPAN